MSRLSYELKALLRPLSGRRPFSFTLVELLVVIAIIAVLTTLLLSGLKSAKAMAHKAACASSLKQMSHLLAFYSQDCDGYIPAGIRGPTTGCGVQWWAYPAGDPDHWTWYDALASLYFDSFKQCGVFCCPAHSPHINYSSGTPVSQSRWFSYGINALKRYGAYPFDGVTGFEIVEDPSNSSTNGYYGRLPMIEDFSGTIMLYEAEDRFGFSHSSFGSSPVSGVTCNNRGNYIGNGTDSAVRIRHLAGSNFLFCDGHVQFIPAGGGYFFSTAGKGTSTAPKGMWTRYRGD